MRVRTKEYFIFENFSRLDGDVGERMRIKQPFSTAKHAQIWIDENQPQGNFKIAQGWLETPASSIYRLDPK